MLAHMKRIGILRLTVAPYFRYFLDVLIFRVIRIKQGLHLLPVLFIFEENLL